MSQPLLFLTHPVALSHLAPVPRRAASIPRFSAGIYPAIQEDSVSGDFSPHTERDLSVPARHSGLSVSWQGTGRALLETSSTFNWFSRYAGSLFLTIVGSIMSALAGYAIKELPARFRFTSDSDPRRNSVLNSSRAAFRQTVFSLFGEWEENHPNEKR
jgi:hypothetical protein